VGSDALGQAQLTSLESEGIATEHVRIVEGATTQLAIAIVEEGVGERTILWHRDPQLVYPEANVSKTLIASARMLHLDGRDSAAALRAARIARELGIPVMVDIDKRYDDSTEELLRLVDYLIAAESFALEFTGAGTAAEAVTLLAGRFPQAITGVTMGSRGAMFLRDGKLLASRAFDVPVRDTTGAGDVFHGAFIFGTLSGWDLEEVIRFSHAAAAIKCGTLGARAGIPSQAEIRTFLKTARERNL
jgi:sugar/nucleoside kinase (ribokinase family)